MVYAILFDHYTDIYVTKCRPRNSTQQVKRPMAAYEQKKNITNQFNHLKKQAIV